MATSQQSTKAVMSRAEAAAYIGVCKTTLDRLDIPKTHIRRRVLYRQEVLDKWLLRNTKGKPA